METQPATTVAIPFGISPEYEHIRLVELPPAVLDELEKGEQPLSLKSVSIDGNGTALICTSTQTFEVRQMQSSNLILLAENYAPDSSSDVSLRAIAQPKGSLELSPKTTDAAAWLRTSLPTVDIDLDTSQAVVQQILPHKTKYEWTRTAPFSVGEVEKGWKDVCAFQWEDVAAIPSPALCLGVWKSINTAALLRGVDLAQPVVAAQFEAVAFEDDLPEPAVAALLTRVSSFDADRFSIDEDLLISWLGENILKRKADLSLDKASFIQEWKDLLPEKWRSKVDLKQIEGIYDMPTQSTIRFGQSSTTTKPQMTKKPASKWHEKLKASRKQG